MSLERRVIEVKADTGLADGIISPLFIYTS